MWVEEHAPRWVDKTDPSGIGASVGAAPAGSAGADGVAVLVTMPDAAAAEVRRAALARSALRP